MADKCEQLRLLQDGNLTEFAQFILSEFAPWKDPQVLLEETEAWFNRYAGDVKQSGDRPVSLMTFQGAKGLEADVVCIIGLEDGSVPRTKGDLAEQSRLLFVSMTRASEDLHLFHARTRPTSVTFIQVERSKGINTLSPSRFLIGIPNEFCERISHWNKR